MCSIPDTTAGRPWPLTRAPRTAIEHEAWSSLAKVMLTSNEFLYID